MKKTARIPPVILALLGLLLQGPLFIPAHAADMNGMADKHTAMQAHKGQGTVNKVDAVTSTVNLTHGPIKSLGWMSMTMDFKVKTKANLDKIKTGMKVDIEITKESDGTFVITRIIPVK